ncbi:LPP20 family lipoprotein [Alteromonas lipolytica]|uniref:Lipoprotein LPP20-like domain-containing protein n=1 Tax=Alteromonas lipolytica TaxID=1856405 RepID=A0A1E8FAC1_9ALTE|nr:LPP20 family lipoprotein [Alteromonas lipolytica]OFI32861.1 hypothetical protein BFC17_00870 [Alteromonas lipolytica]GGF64681.1 hypothetical protein GCM10011338_16350 [Alteromonas lipolytica]
MKKLAIVLPVLFGLGACSSTSDGISTKQETLLTPDCVYQDAPEKSAPLWICGVPVEGYALTQVGFSEKKPSASMTTSAASADARAKMSSYFATMVSDLFSQYQKSLETEEAAKHIIDTDMVRETVSSMTLFGTRTVRTMTSPSGGQYVLIAMDEATYKANQDKVFAALKDEDAEIKQLFENEQARERLMSMIKVQ